MFYMSLFQRLCVALILSGLVGLIAFWAMKA